MRGVRCEAFIFQNHFQLYWFQISNANADDSCENNHDLLYAACIVGGEGAGGGE